MQALRRRVNRSATGSVMLIGSDTVLSPAGLADTRDFPPEGQLAETDAAQTELAEHRARAPTALAAGVRPRRVLGCALALLDHALLRHSFPSQPAATGVCPRNGIPNWRNSPSARSSRPAVVTKVMSIPWIFSTLS